MGIIFSKHWGNYYFWKNLEVSGFLVQVGANFFFCFYICCHYFYKIHGTADSKLSTLSLGGNLLCKSFQVLEFLAIYDNLGGYSQSWVSKSGGPTTSYFS